MALRFAFLGWPPDGPRLRLDYRRFSYAGKFVTAATGKAVARDPTSEPPELDGDLPPPADVGRSGDAGDDDGRGGDAFVDGDDVVAAVAFNEDRTDSEVLWFRYVTVRADRRGEGIGPRLIAFAAARAEDRGYDRLRIAVNNAFSYRALYKAGFAFAGEETGLAELVLERPAGRVAGRDPDTYRAGLNRFRERDLAPEEAAFLDRVADGDPPDVIGASGEIDTSDEVGASDVIQASDEVGASDDSGP